MDEREPGGMRGYLAGLNDGPGGESMRGQLTVPEFPTMPSGETLAAMRISSDPERFVYGDDATLGWLRNRLGQ